eukprot:gene4800-9571_t
MDLDTLLLQLDKKLKSSWSSWTLSHTLSNTVIDDVRNNFDKFDKKIKMRILLSLIGIDSNQRGAMASSIKRLLHQASEDKDEWVPIISGLVHRKLFSVTDTSIEGQSNQTLTKTSQTIIEKLLQFESINESVTDSTYYYQPYECSFLSQKIFPIELLGDGSNQHFKYNSTSPDFLSRERKIIADKLAQDHKVKPSLMPSNHSNEARAAAVAAASSATDPTSTSTYGITSPTTTSQPKLPTSLLPSVTPSLSRPVAPKRTTQSLTLDQLKEKRSSITPAATPTTSTAATTVVPIKRKRKEGGGGGGDSEPPVVTSSTSSSTSTPISPTTTTTTTPAVSVSVSPIVNKDDESSIAKKMKKDEMTSSSALSSSPDKTTSNSISSSVSATPAVPIPVAVPVPVPVPVPAATVDWDTLVRESPLLKGTDKDNLKGYFDNDPKILLALKAQNPDNVWKVKLSEDILTSAEGVKSKATIYMEVKLNPPSWRKFWQMIMLLNYNRGKVFAKYPLGSF